MKRKETILAQLSKLRSDSEGRFVFDQEAIVRQYDKEEGNASGLLIKLLSICGGLLATLAFLGFLAILGFFNSEWSTILLGIGLIGGALVLDKKLGQVIFNTLVVAAFVAGNGLLLFGLFQSQFDEELIPLVFMVVGLSSLVINQNWILSLLAVLIIHAALIAWIFIHDRHIAIIPYVGVLAISISAMFLWEAKCIAAGRKLAKLYNPMLMGLVFAFLSTLVFVGVRNLIPLSYHNVWLATLPNVLAILMVASRVFALLQVVDTRSKTMAYASIVLILLPTAFSPAISGSLLLVLLAFMAYNKTTLVVAIAALIYFVGQYYYDLHFTLLVKSIIMGASGVLFLLFYFILFKKSKRHEKI